MSLKSKATSGFIWSFGQQLSVQFINFIVQLALARLLVPEDFGIVAMLTIFMSLGLAITDGGFTSSLVRTKNPDNEDYSTVFYINLLNSVGIYLILFFTAPFIATFYNQPKLDPIIKVYCLTFIIRAFIAVQSTKLIKEMRFKLQMLMQVPSVIVGAIVGITLAYNGFGVWSIVYMNMLQTLLYCIQHWIFSGWYPQRVFNIQKLKTHFNFGYKLSLSSIIDVVFNNIYNIVIGKFFTPAVLGYYNRADNLQRFPTSLVFIALNRVTYPMFAEISEDNTKLKVAYRKLMQQVLFWIAPLMIYLGVTAHPLILLLMGEAWLPAVPYLQILCIAGILYPLGNANLQILNVKGRSDLYLKVEVIKKVITTIGVLLALPYGIYALLYCQVILSLIVFFINAFYSSKLIHYSTWEQIRDALPVLFVSFATGAIVYFGNVFLTQWDLHEIVQLAINGIAFAAIFFTISYICKLAPLKEATTIIGSLIKKVKPSR